MIAKTPSQETRRLIGPETSRLPPLARLAPLAQPGVAQAAAVGQIIRQKEPENLEFPFAALSDFATPNEQFYVRCHFKKPSIDPRQWRLAIEGAVRQPVELGLDDLLAMPPVRRFVTLECAGNGRIFLHPKENGAQWELGAVSNAEWTGVPLGAVLARAGVSSDAAEIILEGADWGQPDETPRPPGEISFAHSIPASKIDDTLLAYEMNGKELPEAHGAPVRAIVGGWYAMASVKWLTRIVVTERPFHGYFQTVDYSYWEKNAGLPVRVPITEMKVKSQIARPAFHEAVPACSVYRVFGAAWAGDGDIAKVELSTDGGATYSPATLLGDPIRHAWRFWEFDWQTPQSAGRHTLMSRAQDTRGNRQPSERDKMLGNYVISHTLPIEVEVR